jgi:disulfide bond formation protein DsbB
MPLIFFISKFLDKDKVEDYIMPMSILGLFIAIYNYYLQVSPASIGCSTTVSCSSIQLQALGYVTVPVMSLTFFLAIISLSLYSYNKP